MVAVGLFDLVRVRERHPDSVVNHQSRQPPSVDETDLELHFHRVGSGGRCKLAGRDKDTFAGAVCVQSTNEITEQRFTQSDVPQIDAHWSRPDIRIRTKIPLPIQGQIEGIRICRAERDKLRARLAN